MTANLIHTITTDGGFTYAPTSDTLVKVGDRDGFAIAVPGTERIVGQSGITREQFATAFADVVIEFGEQLAAGAYVGGWHSDDRGVYMIELTEIHTVARDEAIRIGTERGQEAILDLRTGEFIETGGNGDGPAA